MADPDCLLNGPNRFGISKGYVYEMGRPKAQMEGVGGRFEKEENLIGGGSFTYGDGIELLHLKV